MLGMIRMARMPYHYQHDTDMAANEKGDA